MAEKIGICILVWDIDSPGGMERQAWRLARSLAKKGAAVTVVSSFFLDKFNLESFCCQKEIRDGVTLYRVPLKPWRYIAVITFYVISLYLLFKLRRRYDALYGVQLYSCGAVASLAGRMLKKPVLVKIAGGGYSGDISISSEFQHTKFMSRLSKWADAYVCLSRQIDNELMSAGFSKDKIVHIPNGVDTSTFYPVKSTEEKMELKQRLNLPDKKIVVFVGRVDSGKRVDFLIEVFKETVKGYPDAHLVIIGDGPDSKKIRAMLDDTITVTGAVTNVEEYLRASDVFVLPTLAEGMSNVILEAMATGLPVITTDVSSNPEIIDDGVDGILLDINDKEGFKKNIVRMLSDEDLAGKMGQAAQNKINKKFSIEKTAMEYILLFEKLVHTGRT